MGSKSVMAFRFSMEDLIEKSGGLYFWTWTFKDVLVVDEACNRWRRFQRQMMDAFPHISGIRVFEIHPGEKVVGGEKLSHGLHIHAIIDTRISVDVVRALWERTSVCGGRIYVEKVGKGKCFYLGKYLTKGRREPLLAGRQLWRCFGRADGERVRDIVVQNEWTEAYKFLKTTVGGFERLPWNYRVNLAAQFAFGDDVETCLNKYGFTCEPEWVNYGEEI